MRRSNLMIAGASAAAGALSLLVAVVGDGGEIGYILAAALIANSFVRYQLAQRQR